METRRKTEHYRERVKKSQRSEEDGETGRKTGRQRGYTGMKIQRKNKMGIR